MCVSIYILLLKQIISNVVSESFNRIRVFAPAICFICTKAWHFPRLFSVYREYWVDLKDLRRYLLLLFASLCIKRVISSCIPQKYQAPFLYLSPPKKTLLRGNPPLGLCALVYIYTPVICFASLYIHVYTHDTTYFIFTLVLYISRCTEYKIHVIVNVTCCLHGFVRKKSI
jgi:hypothetical protein